MEGVEDKSLMKLLKFFKMYKSSWKFKCEKKIAEDSIQSFKNSK